MDTPPRRLLVLGGGVVGCELAQAWSSLGSTEVTIIEAQPNLLATYESFAGEILGKVFEDRFGIRVLTSKRATEVRRQGDEVTVTLDDGSTVSGDEILVAVGRRARTDDLGA